MASSDGFHDLLARARTGDREAREALILRHLDRLRAFVRLKSGPGLRARESCSDLVQSVCREALGELGRLEVDGEDGFQRWLFAVALHKIGRRVEYYRAAKRDPGREETGDAALLSAYGAVVTPSADAAAREEVAHIEAAFDALSEDQREALIQVRLLGRPHREVAEETGRSEEAVRQLLYRARARLALLLRDGPAPQG